MIQRLIHLNAPCFSTFAQSDRALEAHGSFCARIVDLAKLIECHVERQLDCARTVINFNLTSLRRERACVSFDEPRAFALVGTHKNSARREWHPRLHFSGADLVDHFSTRTDRIDGDFHAHPRTLNRLACFCFFCQHSFAIFEELNMDSIQMCAVDVKLNDIMARARGRRDSGLG